MYSDSASDGGGESDGSDENEEMMPSGEDPKSDTTFVLPSMFVGRPPTVFFDYPAFMEKKRIEGVDRVEELTNDKLRPLHFRSNHTIICLGGALKRSGFKRLLKGWGFNVFWGHHLKEHQLQKLGPYQCVNHFPGSYTLGTESSSRKTTSTARCSS